MFRMALADLQIALIVLCLSACEAQDYFPCPSPEWVPVDDSTCIRFVNDFEMTAGQARSWCVSVGASLVRFASSDSMMSFADGATAQGKDGWWSDLTDRYQPGTWTWGGNEKIAQGALVWATEPTDTHHVENCVSMDSGGGLSDDDCNQQMGFICSYILAANASCGGEFQPAGGQCYYASLLDDPAEKVPWAAARNACLAQSPQNGVSPVLANFTTAAQLQGLQQIVAGTATNGKRWVGLNDRFTEREWAWSDGSRVVDTSFFQDQWKHYPDNGQRESCGLVHSNGQMEEANCEDKHYFACQLNINPDNFFLEMGLGCSAPWIRGGVKCYLFSPRHSMSHDNASTFCSASQGRLLKIENKDEQNWVEQQTITGGMFNMWTGLRRSSPGSSTWVWDDGSPADASLYQWNQQPNNYGYTGQDCTFINSRGVYNDADCFALLNFICEMDTENQPCPNRWLSDDSNDMTTCYYLSNNQTASWQEATDKCVELAGLPDAHLVAITSQDELDYMISLMTTHPYTGYWTDLTDRAFEGVWAFSKQFEGTPPPIPWDKEPNNARGNEDCAVMILDGKYGDIDCSRKANVICERRYVCMVCSGCRPYKKPHAGPSHRFWLNDGPHCNSEIKYLNPT